MSIEGGPVRHPVVAFARALRGRLAELADVPVWSMTADDQRTTLVELAAAQAQLDALRLRVLAGADSQDAAASTAATGTVAWLAQATRQSRSSAHRDLLLARALEEGQPAVREALAHGWIDVDQARVIVRALRQLPSWVAADDRERAGRHLVGLAGEHDVTALKVLARRVLEVVDPEAADREEGRRLEAEERAASAAAFLQVLDDGDGSHAGRFRIPTLHAAMLTKALHAFLNPARHRAVDGAHVGGSRPEQLGQAFCELLERLPGDWLPTTAGGSATVVVTIDAERLRCGLGAARLDTGQLVSAAEARRLACDSALVPAVLRRGLTGRSVVLDLGRRTRLHTQAQRLALTVRDLGCTTEGCDRPPGWCHAHHDVAWADGGGTSVDNGRLLCPFHHRRAHSTSYAMTPLPTGQVRFHRRT